MPQSTDTAALGVSVSMSRLRAAAITNEGIVTNRSDRTWDPEMPVVEQVASLLDELAGPERALPVCVAVPGMIETGTCQIVDSRIRELTGRDLRTELNRP